jgi:hypothetical protein
MHNSFRIYRPSNDEKTLEARHLERMWQAVVQGYEFLNANPMPDAFAGRKTREPFPKEQPKGRRSVNLGPGRGPGPETPRPSYQAGRIL